jgi:hypothetical protein
MIQRSFLFCSAVSLLLAGCTGELRSTDGEVDAAVSSGEDAPFEPGTDAWRAEPADAYTAPGTDAWMPTGECIAADRLFAEDFESGGPRAFTGSSYDDAWGNACQGNRTQGEVVRSGSFAQRSEITCTSPEDVHRGYGGLQFSGDRVLPGYTNTGTGVSAPSGVVSTHWVRLRAGAPLRDGRWVSLFTTNPSCDYSARVLTLGLDQPDGILHAAHHWPEGTERVEPGAVAFPMDQWVRLTILVDLDDGVMHVWQNGQSTLHVTGIVRPLSTYCQFHWGLYASGNNTDVELYEDDFALHRLTAPWTDWSREPWIDGGGAPRCP